MSKRVAGKDVYSTGEVAKICRVAPRTVTKWFDAGRLKGYRMPGCNDRRIPHAALVRFLREYCMPMGNLETVGLQRVLLVGLEDSLVDRIQATLPDETFSLAIAGTGFAAGIQSVTNPPDTVVIDLSIGRSDAIAMTLILCADDADKKPWVIALASEDETDLGKLLSYRFSEVFGKPFPTEDLLASLQKEYPEPKQPERVKASA